MGETESEGPPGEGDDPDPGVAKKEMKDFELPATTGKVHVWPAALHALIAKWYSKADEDEERDWIEFFFRQEIAKAGVRRVMDRDWVSWEREYWKKGNHCDQLDWQDEWDKVNAAERATREHSAEGGGAREGSQHRGRTQISVRQKIWWRLSWENSSQQKSCSSQQKCRQRSWSRDHPPRHNGTRAKSTSDPTSCSARLGSSRLGAGWCWWREAGMVWRGGNCLFSWMS